jgi:hypothetical protein
MVLFIWLIIRLIQLVFSAGTIFFSLKKSANSVFQPAYNFSRTGPMLPANNGSQSIHHQEMYVQKFNVIFFFRLREYIFII